MLNSIWFWLRAVFTSWLDTTRPIESYPPIGNTSHPQPLPWLHKFVYCTKAIKSLFNRKKNQKNSCPLNRWCHPTISSSVIHFSSSLQSFPASGSFLMSRLFSDQSIRVSPSVLPRNIQGWFPLGWTGLISLLTKGLSRVFSSTTWMASILQDLALFMVQLSHSYMTTGKTIALTIWTFVSKMKSLLFNTLYRFVIVYLPRSKHLLISWLQSLSTVILEPEKIRSVTVSIVSPSICQEVMGSNVTILVFWMLSFKPAFSHSSFTFIKKLFGSSLFSAIRWYHLHIWGLLGSSPSRIQGYPQDDGLGDKDSKAESRAWSSLINTESQ